MDNFFRKIFNKPKAIKFMDIHDDNAIITGDIAIKYDNEKEIYIPNNVVEIGFRAFSSFRKLENISLSQNLVRIEYCAFVDCENLKMIEFPKSLKYIGGFAFDRCTNLELVILPEQYIYIAPTCFNDCPNLKEFKFLDKNLKEIVLGFDFTSYYLKDGMVVFVDIDTNTIGIEQEKLFEKANDNNKIKDLDKGEYGKLLSWLSFDEIPNKIIVSNMPKNDVKLFYVNNNLENWKKISSSIKNNNDNIITAIFKISYALGVFSEEASESEVATNYILKYIVNQFDEKELIDLFGNFNTYRGVYDKNFAKYFMMYFKYLPNFLEVEILYRNNEETDELNALPKFYNAISKNSNFFNENNKLFTNDKNVRLNRYDLIEKVDNDHICDDFNGFQLVSLYDTKNEDLKKFIYEKFKPLDFNKFGRMGMITKFEYDLQQNEIDILSEFDKL